MSCLFCVVNVSFDIVHDGRIAYIIKLFMSCMILVFDRMIDTRG